MQNLMHADRNYLTQLDISAGNPLHKCRDKILPNICANKAQASLNPVYAKPEDNTIFTYCKYFKIIRKALSVYIEQ